MNKLAILEILLIILVLVGFSLIIYNFVKPQHKLPLGLVGSVLGIFSSIGLTITNSLANKPIKEVYIICGVSFLYFLATLIYFSVSLSKKENSRKSKTEKSKLLNEMTKNIYGLDNEVLVNKLKNLTNYISNNLVNQFKIETDVIDDRYKNIRNSLVEIANNNARELFKLTVNIKQTDYLKDHNNNSSTPKKVNKELKKQNDLYRKKIVELYETIIDNSQIIEEDYLFEDNTLNSDIQLQKASASEIYVSLIGDANCRQEFKGLGLLILYQQFLLY